MWEVSAKNFKVKYSQVLIESGKDTASKRKLTSWANSLPPEFEANFSENRDTSSLTINRKELEKRLGFKFGFLDRLRGGL